MSLRAKGICLVLTGAVLWGIAGTVAQYLFQEYPGFTPEWLVVSRLLISGVLLLGFTYQKENTWAIFKNRHDLRSLILLSILGMIGVQYTYLVAIEASNAATATILQYLAPVIIACYLAISLRRIPTLQEIAALILAMVGTFLIVTHGNIHSLSISSRALLWGLVSAVALAFYTLYPRNLLKKWGAALVTGWGMLIGGISFSVFYPPWVFTGTWTFDSFLAVIFIGVFGTLVAFYCYLESLKYISAVEVSLLACVEPLTSAALAVLWLKVPFGLLDWLGTSCIISALIILPLAKRCKD